MKTKRTAKKRLRKSSSDTRLMKTQQYTILSKTISLVAKSGPSRAEIGQLIALAIRNTKFSTRERNAWRSGTFQTITIAITVLQAWHRHKALVDESANPLSIPLLGGRQSVENVIRREHPECDPIAMAKEIYKLGFIERVGRNKYLPVDIKAYILGDHPLYLLRVMHFAVKFLETIEHNQSATTDDARLLERAVHIENLPKSKLPAFMDISRQQSGALIALVDNWLESNRQDRTTSRKKRSPIVEAGLHVFTYATKPN